MGTEADLFGTSYRKGDLVFRQGDEGDEMYLIQSGAVEISRNSNGEKFVLALFEKGDFFGEMVLLEDLPRSSTATVIDRAQLLPLSRASLKARLKDDPAVALHLLRAFCRRIEKTAAIRNSIESRGGTLARNGTGRSVNSQGTPDFTHLLRSAEAISIRESQETFKADETIFAKGDRGGTMYIILEGAVNIYDHDGDGKYLLASLGPRDFFGEMALLSSGNRTATAVAASPVRLLAVERGDFLDRLSADPDLGIFMLQVMARRLRQTIPMEEPERKTRMAFSEAAPVVLKKEGLLKVAFMALSSCAGCSTVILEDQEGLTGLSEKCRVEYCPLLMDRERIGEVDVAVVEGVVRMKEDEEKLREVRAKSRLLIAWGTCATHGGIPAMANRFELEDLVETSYGDSDDSFSYYLSGTHYHGEKLLKEQGDGLRRRAGRLDDVVRVDCRIPGCPPRPQHLIRTISQFGGGAEEMKPQPLVCGECSRKAHKASPSVLTAFPPVGAAREICLASQGIFCMGMVTRGGCGAVCTTSGLPCWGCRGPAHVAVKKMAAGESFEEVFLAAYSKRSRAGREEVQALLREVRCIHNSSLDYLGATPENPGKVR